MAIETACAASYYGNAAVGFGLVMDRYRSGHNGAHSKCVCLNGHVGSNPTFSAILRGFCQVQEPRFLFGNYQNPLGTQIFTTPARVLSDDTFEFASKWEYVFAVVEKSLCPSHT